MWRAGGGAAGERRPRLRPRATGLHLPPPAIEFPEEGPEPQYDESDLPEELRVVNGSEKCYFTSTIANQLLLVSLLEHLCHMYAQNPVHSRSLFQIICRTFTRLGLLSSFAFCDEFSTLRLQHNRAITQLMKAANQQILEELDSGDSRTVSENEVLFEAQTSRYLNEFDEIARLGKGGYGTVYKVRNKLDGQFYAIKKNLFKKVTKRDCMKVLQEVKVLAGLQHPNIVGYHTAWIEHVQQACPKDKTVLKLQSLKKSSDQESGEDLCHIQNMESSSSIIFADYTSEEIKSSGYNFLENQDDKSMQHMDITKDFTHGDGEERIKTNKCEPLTDSQESCTNSTASGPVHFKNHLSYGLHSNLNKDSIFSSDSCTEDECSQKHKSVHRQCEMEYCLMLHIQMQLCDISLWDWIVDRNKRCGERTEESSSPYHLVDVSWTLKFFQELLEGVYYIHSKGVMHRDIKPRNVFLHGSDHHVKIGDFGLACRDIIQENPNHWLTTEKINGLKHTSGVGTCLYASPEQLQGSHYDFKSDMYSVGVILLELFQPFGTEMERTKILTSLRNGHIPSSFSSKWPVQTKYVKLLTSEMSSQRPTAAQLLESELFHTTENVICSLQQKVMQQEEEIEKLKEKINLFSREREIEDEHKRLGSPV
ncbi:eukaryotic translation initiation factor 2-alpha kinase 1 isoform X3 [Dermochelys coriacea]|uniref:eukaryotic translation initiation factor 2-alpha kinase 1 isoform X3 n=1 Tax=Dermochelys coriacea TaxID=27794 RepID=UPI0018E7389C|nr:eukaryotic translation initiation factor 2-alpha kinase 1 isoform X3 [Dermochelys coriacea]